MSSRGLVKNSKIIAQKNIALSPVGYRTKSMRRTIGQRFIKSMGKLVIVVNLALIGVVGCTDLNFDKELIKAAIGGAVDATVEHGFNPQPLQYYIEAGAAKLFEYGLNASLQAMHK
jgi:hypothetical protein